MAHLAGKHGDLSTVMSVVSDKVADERRDIWTKILDPPITVHRTLDGPAQSCGASLESLYGIGWRHRCLIKLLGNLFRLGGLQPHQADIVHVSDNRGDGSTFTVGRFGRP